ncbi:hypothetical protein N5A93_19055 [Roseovarius sp. EGI FJ00037]|uniref:hypothetical protein n=1 Tax=Roseovarius salincola TaxID=2978479 RepID=UPI0022A84033|nr:hypothetical protein [Roseovarius sp. EGI FJ00037]MCZ0814322.1 hypothetical protein [Roseovarius sp. EGI FJ00037]
MNAYADYLANTTASQDEPRVLAAMASVLRRMDGALKRGAQTDRLRRMAIDLEQLNDRLLKDIGIRREHFPSGAIRIVRR